MTQTNLFNPAVYRRVCPEMGYPINPAVYRRVNYRNHPQQRASVRCDHGRKGAIVGARHAVPLLMRKPHKEDRILTLSHWERVG